MKIYKSKLHKILCWILLTLLLTVTGCKLPEFVDGESNQYELTQDQIDAQINLKGGKTSLADRRRNQLVRTFVERNAMAEVVSNDPKFDTSLIDAELINFRNEKMISRYLESQVNNEVSDEAVKTYYDNNIEKFTKRRVRVAHILFKIDPSMDDQTIAEKEEIAKEVVAKINSNESFEDLAITYSEDKSSGRRGGEIGWLESGRDKDELLEAGLALQEGEVSEVIRTQDGFSIVRVLEGPTEEQLDFETQKDKIAYDLKYQQRLQSIDDLKKKAANRISQDLARFNVQ